MTERPSLPVRCAHLGGAAFLALATLLAWGQAAPPSQSADYIVAVVNQELVTNGEVQQRLARIRDDAARNKATLPPPAELRKQVLDQLINERVLVTNARESGARIDEVELDRAVANVATQNQLTLPQLRERLRSEGIAYAKFRDNVRDQLLVERVREREVVSRIKISDAEIDELLDRRRAEMSNKAEYDIAQILISVPDGASVVEVVERRNRALAALQRVRAGADFATVAREVSEDGNRVRGGDIGMRAADRLPDIFVQAVQALKAGDIAPELIRSEAGFHVLKLVARKDPGAFSVQQTHVRHILLRPSNELSVAAAASRLLQFKREIESGAKTFEQVARANSEDGSAARGGDLGWASPGAFVPEFEEAINALPMGGLSDPIVTRFGVHLVQVVDRRTVTLDAKQQREQARNILRERKFEEAYAEWLRDLRGRAYVELREPPQ
ncbi:MAG: peptidylprolyl isomerase [Caldimonas sp.]